jgi:hypothetical protein
MELLASPSGKIGKVKVPNSYIEDQRKSPLMFLVGKEKKVAMLKYAQNMPRTCAPKNYFIRA